MIPTSTSTPTAAAAGPLLSVIVLSYNYGRFLAACIDSVLAQDYAPLQVIVVDDGSTDESRAVIARYGPRITAALKSNGGEASSMNLGFALSEGEVVVFLDSDDYLLPGALAAHVRALASPGVVRSQAYLTVLDGDRPAGERLPSVPVADGDLRTLILERGPGAYVSPPNSGNAWSRRFLEQVFPLPEHPKTIGGETYLMDSAPLFGASVTLTGPAAAYRRHGANTSGVAATMNAANIAIAIRHREARIERLVRVATALGYVPQADRWMSSNWRFQTLSYLSNRLGGSAPRLPLSDHLRPALAHEHPAKRSLLAAGLIAVRVAPLTLSLFIASRMIKLRYL